MIKVIFFDLGNTLVKTQKKSPYIQILELSKLDESWENKVTRLLNGEEFSDLNDFLIKLGRLLKKEITSKVKRGIYDIWELDAKKLDVYRDVYSVLERLRKASYKLGVISNISQFAVEILFKKTKLREYIDDFIFSYEVGYLKPAKEIFENALSKFGVTAHEAVMVGDSYKDDALGAWNAGISPYWLRRGIIEQEIGLKNNSVDVAPDVTIVTSLKHFAEIFLNEI